MNTHSRRSIGPARNPEAHRAILAAARELLNEGGYGRLSIDAVARRAGASKPTIYRWWKNKAALMMEVYETEVDQSLRVPDLGDIEKELTALLANLWRMWRDTSCGALFRSIIAEAQLDGTALQQLREQFMPRRRAYTIELLERARDRGELDEHVDVEQVATWLMAFCWYHLLTDQLGDEAAIEQYVRSLVLGLRKPR
jgi:AcrR family transcriptional regulator